MNVPLEPDAASAALVEIARRRRQVVDVATTFPSWYWPLLGVAMVGLAAVVDTRNPVSIGVAVVCFVVIVLADTAAVVVPRYRRATWRQELLGTRGAFAIVAFVWVVVGVTLALAFALEAAGVSHPATIGCSVGAVIVIVGGPYLMGRVRSIMLDKA
jgi:hypothetical protein